MRISGTELKNVIVKEQGKLSDVEEQPPFGDRQ